jgi:trans-2,3-dihydro-3-hydroxyanthranilate isomerase
VPPDVIAKALRLHPEDVLTTNHAPVATSTGTSYVIAELADDALSRCDPDLAMFREARDADPRLGGRFSVHVYSKRGRSIRARMFAPLAGTWEDPATGSANAALACLLLSLEAGATEDSFIVHQGVEMGRPSVLHVDARRTPDGIVATLRGSCVPVMRGELTV